MQQFQPLRPYFHHTYFDNHLREVQSRHYIKSILLPPRTFHLLAGPTAFDSPGRRTNIPQEIFWIVQKYLGFGDIVNLISSGAIPWSEYGQGRGYWFAAICPVFSSPADPYVNIAYLKYLVMSLLYGDESYCKLCRTSNPHDRNFTSVYWVWMTRCCNNCASLYTISEYDLIEAGLDQDAELAPQTLPLIRKQFPKWGSVAYKFYWAPDVLYFLKNNTNVSFNVGDWYCMIEKYRKWTQIHKSNSSRIKSFLQKSRAGETVIDDVLLTCTNYHAAMAETIVFTNSQWTPIEKSLVEEYEEQLKRY